MAEQNGSNNVAIVAIVVIVLIAIGIFIYFWGFGSKSTTVIKKPEVHIESPAKSR